MESPNVKIKAEPADAVSFLSPPRPRDKNKKSGQIIEISSSEEENASPTPKAKRWVNLCFDRVFKLLTIYSYPLICTASKARPQIVTFLLLL